MKIFVRVKMRRTWRAQSTCVSAQLFPRKVCVWRSAHDGEAGTLRGREEAAVKHTLPARTLCTACPARASAFFPGSWGHVGVYRAGPRVTSGKSLWFSSFKDQAVEEKCLLLLSCYSHWNALKNTFPATAVNNYRESLRLPGQSICVCVWDSNALVEGAFLYFACLYDLTFKCTYF